MMLRPVRFLLVAILALLSGCAPKEDSAERSNSSSEGRLATTQTDDSRGQPLVLLAAASTKDAIERLAAEFEQQTGTPVRVSSGPSNALATQIETGAPADLFLSANEEWADSIKSKGLAEATTPLLTNSLVLIVPKGNPAAVHSAADLSSLRVKRVALAGEKVPAGKYAEQALRASGLYESLVEQRKIVRGQDVRIALSYVARGEADAGLVYSSDARADDAVEVIERFDPTTYERIIYPLVLLKREPPHPKAREFYDYLRSDEAAGLFERFGFQLMEVQP